MDSKDDLIALEAIRQFKNGQLYAWVNDEEESARHFDKCSRAIGWAEEYGRGRHFQLEVLKKRVSDEPRRKELFREAKKLPELPNQESYPLKLTTSGRTNVTYTLVPLSSNCVELRVLIRMPWRTLRKIAKRSQNAESVRHIAGDQHWHWIEVDTNSGYTGTFFLTYADGVLFGQIITHEFLNNVSLEKLEAQIATFLSSTFR